MDDVRRAMELSGFRWLVGMQDAYNGERVSHVYEVTGRLVLFEVSEAWEDDHASRWNPTVLSRHAIINPDDPATGGCLLELLGADVCFTRYTDGTRTLRWGPFEGWSGLEWRGEVIGATLGRACIAAALALGRWPGGEG